MRIIEQALMSNTPVPDKIRNAPQILPGLEWAYKAFIDLHSCRQSGWGPGPIPYTAISEYAHRNGMSNELFRVLLTFIRRLDVAYLNHCEEKRKK